MTHLPFGFETRIFIFIFISKIGFIEQPRILIFQLILNLKLDSLHQLRFIRQDQSLRVELVDITSKMGHHLTQTGLQVYKIKWAGWWKDTFSYGPARVILSIENHQQRYFQLYDFLFCYEEAFLRSIRRFSLLQRKRNESAIAALLATYSSRVLLCSNSRVKEAFVHSISGVSLRKRSIFCLWLSRAEISKWVLIELFERTLYHFLSRIKT